MSLILMARVYLDRYNCLFRTESSKLFSQTTDKDFNLFVLNCVGFIDILRHTCFSLFICFGVYTVYVVFRKQLLSLNRELRNIKFSSAVIRTANEEYAIGWL